MRKFQFQTREYYHIYNRGVDGRNVFVEKGDYIKFLKGLRELNNNSYKEERDFILRKAKNNKKEEKKEFNSEYSELNSFLDKLPKLVEIVCYCLNPNHYHLLLKQKTDKGIEKFMQKLGTSYTNYFNEKNKRSGALFQGRFKSIHVASTDYLLQLSCYINGNPEIHKIAKAENYPWSSYQDYLEKRNSALCGKKEVMAHFEDAMEYKNLVDSIINDSAATKEEMKKLFLEEKI